MTEHKTLVDALARQAAGRPRRAAYTIAEDPDGPWLSIDYGDLFAGALRVATALGERGMRRGDRVLVCLPTGLDLLVSLYGVLVGGGVVVPVYPPFASRTLAAWKARIAAAATTVQPAGAIVGEEHALHLRAVLAHQGPGLFTVTPAALSAERGRPDPAVDARPDDLALVQLTSGTTSAPRGAAITHGNLMANIDGVVDAMSLGADDVSVSWLPPYHDMGLIGHIFTPLCSATHELLMSPRSFRESPARWLRLVTVAGATQTTAPNAAYEICARRVTAAERATLDLATLRWALNGAEQVHPETIDRFVAAFGPRGFRREALRPVYGLAEATLAATFGDPGAPVVDRLDRERLACDGVAAPPSDPADAGQAIVAVGRPFRGHEIEVVDAAGAPAGPGHLGEILLRGPSVMRGYFNDPVATAAAIRPDGWLRTGDLGYVGADGALRVAGRLKELIIKNGRNFAPHDLEGALEAVPGLRAGRAVACGVPSPDLGTEEIVLVVEARRPAALSDDELRRRAVAAVADATGARPDRVVIVEPGALPKTSSGKLRRRAVRLAIAGGETLCGEEPRLAERLAPGLQSLASLVEARLARVLGWR